MYIPNNTARKNIECNDNFDTDITKKRNCTELNMYFHVD